MTPGDILWLFFVFSALQPVLKQRFLDASRQRLIAKIERQRHSRVILLVHRQETMSFLGFPVSISCCTRLVDWCWRRCKSPAPSTNIRGK